MTAHGPEAIRLVAAAWAAAGLADPPGNSIATANITGHALDVVKGRDRAGAIDAIVYRWDLTRPAAAKLLDLAVEALTANPPQE